MGKKILGIALCVVGFASLIISLIYVSVIGNPTQVVLLLAGGITGAVVFFMGISVLPGAGIHIVHTKRPVEQSIIQQN